MKRFRRFSALLLVLVVFLTSLVHTAASPAEDIRSELDALAQQADEIAAQKQALEAEKKATEAEILSFAEQKFQLDREVALLRQEVENLTEQLHQYNLLIAQKQDALFAAQTELEELTAHYLQRMRAIQERGGISEWAVVFSSFSFEEMLNRKAMVEEIAKADQRMMDALRAATAEVLQAKDALADGKAALEMKKLALSEAETTLQARRAEADEMLQTLAASKTALLDVLNALSDAENRLSDEIAKKEQAYYDALQPTDPGTDAPRRQRRKAASFFRLLPPVMSALQTPMECAIIP